jgi:hypothetical protein
MGTYEEDMLRREIAEQMQEKMVSAIIVRWSVIGTFLLLLCIIGGMVGCPRYKVYQQNLEGKAELAKATQNRQIRVQESMAKFEAAIYEKQADSTRAVGIHISNTIIGQSLKDNEAYLKWLWITDVAGANIDKTIVYIPTETNIPILEANRLNKQNLNVTVEAPKEKDKMFGGTKK